MILPVGTELQVFRLTVIDDYDKIKLLLLCFVVLFFVLSQIKLNILTVLL